MKPINKELERLKYKRLDPASIEELEVRGAAETIQNVHLNCHHESLSFLHDHVNELEENRHE